MTFEDLMAEGTDRAFISGRTGSGKSYLARRLLRYVRDEHGKLKARRYILVYDAKGMLTWARGQARNAPNRDGWFRVTTFAKLLKCANDPMRFPKIVYAPNAKELRDKFLHEAFFRLAYERRETTVYVDEVAALVDGRDYPESYHAILTRGREMHVPILTATQRPMGIPQSLMSESDVFYTFHLQLEQDQDKMSKIVPTTKETIAALPERWFVFYRVGEREASVHTLEKPKRSTAVA